jgi:hypothetical protein
MPLCKIYGCRHANSHETKDHKCGNCNRLGHGRVECKSSHKKYPDTFGCGDHSIVKQVKNTRIRNNHYITLFGAQGSTWYIRNTNGHIEYFFLHTDSHGQYGEHTSHIARLNGFIRNYTQQ